MGEYGIKIELGHYKILSLWLIFSLLTFKADK